jgi:hypothetical protein
MSILIPAQEPLYHRSCDEEQYYHLLTWFAHVELLAWEWVNTFFADDRPKRIFLVTGQTMSPAYSIAHKESGLTECEILLEANVGIPNILDGKALVQYKVERAYANLGFEEETLKSGTDKYTIFLEVFNSGPIRLFKLGSLKNRLYDMYRCITCPSIADISDSSTGPQGRRGGLMTVRLAIVYSTSSFLELLARGATLRFLILLPLLISEIGGAQQSKNGRW